MSPGVAWAQAQAHRPVALKITAHKTTLRVGETLQLRVMSKFPDRSTKDVTASSLTQYASDDRRVAVVNKTGLVQTLSTQERTRAYVGIIAYHGDLGIGLRLTVVQKETAVPLAPAEAEEPIALEIAAPKTTLREGETVQLRVIATFADGSTKDVTSTRHGTIYQRTFRRVTLDHNGLVTAFSPEERTPDSERIWLMYKSFVGVIDVTILKAPPPVQGDALEVSAPKTALRVGETAQLTVLQKLSDGSTRDLTDPRTGTTYDTTNESMLIPEPDGRVTCIGTRRRAQGYAVIGVRNGKLKGWIRFKLLPAGPGPRLEVIADKAVLHEGEHTQLHVYKPLPDGGRQEVTATSTGTRYLTFPYFGRYDPSMFDVRINNKGLASAPASIGRLPRITQIVFVRNEESVGWTKLKVLPAGARK